MNYHHRFVASRFESYSLENADSLLKKAVHELLELQYMANMPSSSVVGGSSIYQNFRSLAVLRDLLNPHFSEILQLLVRAQKFTGFGYPEMDKLQGNLHAAKMIIKNAYSWKHCSQDHDSKKILREYGEKLLQLIEEIRSIPIVAG